MKRFHSFPFGAQPTAEGTTFRLWAPRAQTVELVLVHPVAHPDRGADVVPAHMPMNEAGDGFFEARDVPVGPSTRYRYRVDGRHDVPDPASRFQPDDVYASSRVVDPREYDWQIQDWSGRPWDETILYELHLGTFTRGGTYHAAGEALDALGELGVTAVELMPLSDFPGERNWGYDGVLPYAPDSVYGSPNELKSLIDECHRRDIMVFLDVVYNHFGPEANYLWLYARDFFTDRYHTPWGDAVNFGQRQVREFFIHNAIYWLEEYCVDGLRLDAVHAIHDDSEEHILTELARRVRHRFGNERHVHLVLENDANEARFLDTGRRLFTAQWNDDFHHVSHVLLTGETAGYYQDYAEATGRKLAKSLAEGFVYQGEPSPFRGGEGRGESSAHLPAGAFVNFLQNHDQIGNRAFGERLTRLSDEARLRLLTAIQLLSPQVPLLFMGEEWGSTAPFQFFCDFHDELAGAVRDGRRGEFASFPEFSDPAMRERIPDPNDPNTFSASLLDWDTRESDRGRAWLEHYRALVRIRKTHLFGHATGATTHRVDQLGAEACVLQWRLEHGRLWQLCWNLSSEELALPGLRDTELVMVLPDGRASQCARGALPAMTVACGWSVGE